MTETNEMLEKRSAIASPARRREEVNRRLFTRCLSGIAVLFSSVLFSGCLPPQIIIVRFEDLKEDMHALETSLNKGEWARFDPKTMTITIATTPRNEKDTEIVSYF